MRRISRLAWSLSLCLTVFASSASIAANAEMNALQQCAKITNTQDRLICYDAVAAVKNDLLMVAAEPVATKEAKKAVIKANAVAQTSPVKSEPVASKEQLVSGFGNEHKVAEEQRNFDQVSFVIKSVDRSLRELLQIEFDNGQVWHQTDNDKRAKFSVGDVVVIKRGVLSAFYMKKAGSHRQVRVKRIK